MSIEKSFKLITEELENLRCIFEHEREELKQRIEFYRSELQMQHAAHLSELEREKGEFRSEIATKERIWDNERVLLEGSISELQHRIIQAADTRPLQKVFLECLPTMAFICDINGEMLECNQSFSNFFEGRNFPFGSHALDAARERGSWAGELLLRSAFGLEGIFDARLFSWDKHSGEPGGFVGVTIDKTRLRAVERELSDLKIRADELDMLLSGEAGADKRRKELRCVLFGHEGSGKTCLLNALLGEQIVPGKCSIPVRCAKGTKRALAVHYWNGDRKLFLDSSADRARADSSLGDALWLEWRLPEAKIPNSIMLEESREFIPEADMFIATLPVRGRFSRSQLEDLNEKIKDGVYGIFVISKADIETNDYEGAKIAVSAKEKIENACELLRKDLMAYSRLRNCHVIPISVIDELNFDVLRWYLEDAASSLQFNVFLRPSLPIIKYPEREVPVGTSGASPLLPILEAFREQEFQKKFESCISSFGKNSCVVLGPRVEDAHNFVSRLAHDISFAKKLTCPDGTWVILSEEEASLSELVRVEPPESILKKINFIIAPEDKHIRGCNWDELFSKCVPIVILTPDLEFAPYKDALKKYGFCAVCGDGLVMDEVKTTEQIQRLKDFADEVHLFIYENYEVFGGRVLV